MAEIRFDNRVAIVTGAGGGLGRSHALLLASRGAKVVVNDLGGAMDGTGGGGNSAADKVVAEIKAAGGQAVASYDGVDSWEGAQKIVAKAKEAFGKLDIVINNAGTTHRNQPILNVTEEQFDRVYAVNVKSLFWSARHCIPVFRKQGGGVFITIASTAGVRPRPGLTWYNGSKGAAILASRSMAVELAPDKIRVNVINPVAGETPLLAEFMGGADTPEMRAKFIASVPFGRLSRPEDVANAALYLASDEANFITGACIEVDGGRCV